MSKDISDDISHLFKSEQINLPENFVWAEINPDLDSDIDLLLVVPSITKNIDISKKNFKFVEGKNRHQKYIYTHNNKNYLNLSQ